MSTSLLAYPRFPSPLATHPRRITRLGCVGMGEVVHKKIWPALQAQGFPLTGIVVCSLEPSSRLAGLPYLYHAIEPNRLLPLDALEAQGFLGDDTLWIVATPSASHGQYTAQLAGLCRVGVEKPLASTGHHARRLLPFVHHGSEIYPIDHKLFNASSLAFIAACRQRPAVLAGISHIAGVFYETAGVSRGRHQEDCIADVQGHLFTPVIAAYRAAGIDCEMTVDQVRVTTHEPDLAGCFQSPEVWTASRIQGQLVYGRQAVSYGFCQAKAAPRNEKGLRFFDDDNRLIGEIDLNETGWYAHARVLEALLQPVVDMRHTLDDAITVMELIDASREIAHQEATYAFGILPYFLAEAGCRGAVIPASAVAPTLQSAALLTCNSLPGNLTHGSTLA